MRSQCPELNWTVQWLSPYSHNGNWRMNQQQEGQHSGSCCLIGRTGIKYSAACWSGCLVLDGYMVDHIMQNDDHSDKYCNRSRVTAAFMWLCILWWFAGGEFEVRRGVIIEWFVVLLEPGNRIILEWYKEIELPVNWNVTKSILLLWKGQQDRDFDFESLNVMMLKS